MCVFKMNEFPADCWCTTRSTSGPSTALLWTRLPGRFPGALRLDGRRVQVIDGRYIQKIDGRRAQVIDGRFVYEKMGVVSR